jgi:hypothetical protein
MITQLLGYPSLCSLNWMKGMGRGFNFKLQSNGFSEMDDFFLTSAVSLTG